MPFIILNCIGEFDCEGCDLGLSAEIHFFGSDRSDRLLYVEPVIVPCRPV